MFDFQFHNPTKIIFGKKSIPSIAKECSSYKKILLTYGGGSIKKNGVYDKVKQALAGKDVIEFGGIPANPTYEVCMDAVELGRKEEVDFVLAVGGGSVLDASKFIAAAIKYTQADPWEIVLGKPFNEALPVGAVMTLPATGSEMNGNSVISKVATQEKIGYGHPLNYPKFSVLDPTTTFSLPESQTINGIIDAFIHVCEQFITKDVNAMIQDYQAIAVLKTLVSEGPKVLADPEDYDARANMMWASTNALNGYVGQGVVNDWSCHGIGHELTAFYGLDHAISLAILQPRIWEYKKEAKADKLRLLAKEVWGETGSDAVEKGITRTEEFFRSLGAKTKLAEWDISAEEAAQKIYDRFKPKNLVLGEDQDLTPEVVAEIVKKC